MTIEQIRQQLIDEGVNIEDVLILPSDNGYSVWMKQYAPKYMVSTDEIRQHDVGVVKVAGQNATKRLIIEGVLNAEELAELAVVYDKWTIGKPYEPGDVFNYEGDLCEVIQPHTAEAHYTPDMIPALVKSHAPAGTIIDWYQPAGAHDAFKLGQLVRYPAETGQVYKCIIDKTTHNPVDYPQAWELQ